MNCRLGCRDTKLLAGKRGMILEYLFLELWGKSRCVRSNVFLEVQCKVVEGGFKVRTGA